MSNTCGCLSVRELFSEKFPTYMRLQDSGKLKMWKTHLSFYLICRMGNTAGQVELPTVTELPTYLDS